MASRGWREFLFLVQVSRPGFWLTSLWFYLLPVGGIFAFGHATFWLGALYVTFPLGLLIYGWNDIVDYETDRRNPRKGTYLFGAKATPEQLRRLPLAIAFVQLPFLAAFTWLEGPRVLPWATALILATAIYNGPRGGLKGCPPFEMLNQIGYLLVFVLASWLGDVEQLPWSTFVFGALFAMHSHLFGQIMDVVPDRESGRRTTAVNIGIVPAKLLLVGFLVAEAALVGWYSAAIPIAAFLAVAALWFLLDALVLWREHLYSTAQMRLFLLGWNAVALGTMPLVWWSGALTRSSARGGNDCRDLCNFFFFPGQVFARELLTIGRVKTESVDTHSKALRVNLDPQWYGTFAEIGAGQEVVRWFFRVGAAAGTIAQSISAYDMKVSDAIYGRSERYVSKGRLQAMLDREFELNIERLGTARGDTTAFFAFADTVVARSFKGGNECHGWMGIKFQSRPHDEPSQILIHVRMLDAEASLQQEALGIVGVNLCHGAFFLHHAPEQLVESLLDMLTTGRIEIDMIEFTGIEFRNVDNRVMALQLVQLGLSGAAMFGANREVLQPTEVLYKKAVLVERGSFRPMTNVNIDMLECALAKFKADPAVADKQILPVTEITMRNLLAGGKDVDRRDFLARAELLAACGMTVLISDYFEYYRLAAYLAWRTKERIGIVMGVPSLVELFDEKYYQQLPGGVLESFGRLFKNDLKLYVYPYQQSPDAPPQTIHTLEVSDELRPLYDYLAGRGSFVHLDNSNPKYSSIFSRDVLKRIAKGDDTWEQMVPPQVAELIRKRGFFGCPTSV